jgi:hypothetical protein
VSFLKVHNQQWHLFHQFLKDFNELHVILMRIASQIRTCFRNQNPTTVAQTAMIFLSFIEFQRQTKQEEDDSAFSLPFL